MSVILETTIGDLVIDVLTDERPRACLNFLKLCKVKFYNYSLFHFVQRNFLAQTGDPTGSGRGGESIFRSLYGDQAKFFEAETKPRIKHVKRGTVSMVNNGNDMHGSQFFITLGENLDYLDGQHTVFGEVAEGFDILDKLNEAICDDSHRPYQDIRITHTVILDDPFDDPPGLQVPDRSPEPTKEQLDSGRIGADEEIDDTKGKTMEEVEEMIEEREFKAGAQILEMVGDIPDADVKPPENVLFVCKLNPVTTDEDLEIIFSRFGPIKSCEIIRDSVSKESLQYAFIEYENVEDCERAYFKMDNVLIDDRRIHVDFSQSVAKLVYNKPGSKPVYELKEKKETKPNLQIKDSSRKEKYDLVFEDTGSDRGSDSGSEPANTKVKESVSKQYSKEKEDRKKRRHTASEERSPKNNRKRGDFEEKRFKNRHGDQRKDRYDDSSGDRRGESKRFRTERQGREPRDRKSEERYQDKRDRKRKDRHEDREYKDQNRDKEERRTENMGRSWNFDKNRKNRDRDKEGHRGKRDDRYEHRSSEERYPRSDRDKRRHRGTHELEEHSRHEVHRKERNSEDRQSRDKKDHNKDRKGQLGKEKGDEGSPEKSRKKRQHSDDRYTGEGRGRYKRRKESQTTRNNRKSSESVGSEEEYHKKKRTDYKEKNTRNKRKKYRQDSSDSSD